MPEKGTHFSNPHQSCQPFLRLASTVDDACVVIIPSWRHHVVQYDRLSAALESFKVPTAVSPLRDGLWAFLLQRLQVSPMAPEHTVLEHLVVYSIRTSTQLFLFCCTCYSVSGKLSRVPLLCLLSRSNAMFSSHKTSVVRSQRDFWQNGSSW